jgi:putative hemolysin
MEDIVEEIVGEIEGEYDLPDNLHREEDGTVLVAGSMTIDDFNEAVGTTLLEPGVRTMTGLMFSTLGRRPQRTSASSRLTVEQVDGTRITRLRVEPETGPLASWAAPGRPVHRLQGADALTTDQASRCA